MDIQQEIKTYLYHCENQKKLNMKSIKAYSIDLKQFMHYVNAIPEQNLTKPVITEYIVNLHKTYLPRTAKRKLASLRAFLNYLEFEDILNANPIHKIKTKFQEPKLLPKILPLKIIERLIAVAYQEKYLAKTVFGLSTALRDAAIIEVLFATGMRVSELCSLKLEDINLEDGTIRITGKGTKERFIQIINSDVLTTIRQYHNTALNRSIFFLLTNFHPAFQSNLYVL
jgi:integrase/recombinase XerD